MKKLFSFIVLFVLISIVSKNLYAKIYTVSNRPTMPAMFTTIQAAVDSAKQGDTIYVQGSPVIYPDFTVVNKRLHIFGPGFSPITSDKFSANVNYMNIRNTTTDLLSNGGSLQGFVIGFMDFTLNAFNDRPVNNYSISRCAFVNGRINFYANVSNLNIENCYFTSSNCGLSFSAATFTNIIIQNNVFRLISGHNGAIIGLLNSSNVLINHNVFYTTILSGNGALIFESVFSQAVRSLTLSNNIFINSNISNSVLQNSSFYNNITFYSNGPQAPANIPWLSNNNLDGGGNIYNQDPSLISHVAISTGADAIGLDFRANAGQATNAGSDGKDIGLLFNTVGSLNWERASTSRMPVITQLKVKNPTVGPNGTIQIEIKAVNNN